jgi:hypothetical protein
MFIYFFVLLYCSCTVIITVIHSICLLIDGGADVLPGVPGVHARNVQDDEAKVRDGFDPAGVLEGAPVELPLDAQVGVVGRAHPTLKVGGHPVTQTLDVLQDANCSGI